MKPLNYVRNKWIAPRQVHKRLKPTMENDVALGESLCVLNVFKSGLPNDDSCYALQLFWLQVGQFRAMP